MAGAVMARPLVLDFDGSVAPLDGADSVPLQERQELIRFGCRKRELDALARDLEPILESRPPLVFLGSGDFHHVSYMLVERLRRPIQVVVFDNHPDNMRYPFGIHCGSWIWHVSRLPFVARVHVAGITSHDVSGFHIVENHLRPLLKGRVVYWCVGPKPAAIFHRYSFSTIGAMLEALIGALKRSDEPVYLSIDKDVLANDVVQTNWDQGVMRLEELMSAIAMLRGRIVGADVTGDISLYEYRSRLKRILSAIDRQPEVDHERLGEWQSRHRYVNQALIASITEQIC